MSFFKAMDNLSEKSENMTSTGVSEKVKCLIIGSGPAGYTAAIYAARANLSPVVYEGLQPGGQLTTTTEVENFPGYPEGVTGPVMMEDLKKQAQRFGADIRFGYATAVDFSVKPHKVQIDGEKWIEADAVIIATGATAKYLGLPSEEKFKGFGVSACATCDGFFYRKKVVAVVGGGDTACEEATYLSGLCSKVYLIVRKEFLRASKAMQHRVMNTPNLEVLFGHVTKEIVGDQGVNGVILTNNKGEDVKLDIDGFFVAIGHEPNSSIFKPYLNTDETGYILTVPGTSKTNVPGVFACGDVQDKVYRQAVTAAGTGCMAALDCERYLAELH
jgi:thioredoxin reductase (NADPH)